jgi:N6-adenosine-specific RNA methylase IME4
VSELFTGLPLFHFGAILCDPPWRFKTYSVKGEAKNASAHYDCMGIRELSAMPVNQLAATDCAMVMWCTAPMLQEGLELLRAWGFDYKSMGAWAKQSSTGAAWAFGTGYTYRSAVEPYILGTRGRPKVRSHSTRNLIVAPVREHSRKPDQMHCDVEAMFAGPYLELFARSPRAGWTVWGNETDKFGGAA